MVKKLLSKSLDNPVALRAVAKFYPQFLWKSEVFTMKGMMDGWHGDEFDIAEEARKCAEEHEAEHADDWKYSDERLGYEHE